MCTSWSRWTDDTYYSSVPFEIHFYALWELRTMSKGNHSCSDTVELNPPISNYIHSPKFRSKLKCTVVKVGMCISVHTAEELQYVEMTNVLAIVIVSPWRLGSSVTAGFPVITRLGMTNRRNEDEHLSVSCSFTFQQTQKQHNKRT